MSAGAVVTELIQANEARDIEAVLAVMTDDIEYENVGMGVCTGHDEVRALLGPFLSGAERVAWEVLAQLERGDTVMNERVDRFFLPGGKQVEARVAGYFEVQDGKVRRWRDYFDTAALLRDLQG
ncbi:MAG TPA: limonene-1,2-epoxide hydrolase family protein [Acidimicrobiia bacterium]|jgi:limonene-1,2-epoxide hydrolase|nr:limonene-1,2-epoxide hydrolase family protein [Acidimicrobiia bacterium]